MSGIIAVIHTDGAPAAEPRLLMRMLTAMAGRGSGRSMVWRDDFAALAAARHDWECGPGFSGPALVVHDDEHAIVADASLYYRDDLRRKLAARRVRAAGNTPSHLILAAYRAFGDDCADVLEGDCAFVIWDRRKRRIFAARDFGGKRPLFYAELNGGRTLVIGSTIAGILEHPACSREIDLGVVTEAAAGLRPAHDRTAWSAVRTLLAGKYLVHTPGAASCRVVQHWDPPRFDAQARTPFADAAEELRELLVRASAERIANVGTASTWLSGGWDSPSVFGCAQQAATAGSPGSQVLPVSMSYPVGDPGREDELIASIAVRWKVPVHWIDVTAIPIIGDGVARANMRDEPLAHLFELWNRSLAAGSRKVSARVALDGNGGDQLFGVSDAYLADFVAARQWRSLWTHWRTKGLTGAGNFYSLAVQPLLPDAVRSVGRRIGLHHAMSSYLEPELPQWVDRRFAERHGIIDRMRENIPKRGAECPSSFEARWFLTYQHFPRMFSMVASYALEAGVENRSPLYDRRIIAFAATRPRYERSSLGQTKQLLRRAVKYLLPPEVLAPRRTKTGVTSGHLERGLAAEVAAAATPVITGSRLAAAGIVDSRRFERAAIDYLDGRSGKLGRNVAATIHAEMWMRTRAAAAN